MAQYDPFNPYTSPAGPGPVPADASGPFARLGDYLTRGFRAYFDRWSDWLGPVLAAIGVGVVALLCCYFPMFLVFGPLMCGLFACAFRVLRNQPISASDLWQGWPTTWTAMLSWIALQLLVMLPALVIYGVIAGTFFGFAATVAPGGPAGGPPEAAVAAGFVGIMLVVAVFGFLMLAWMLWINTRTMFVMPLIADRQMSLSTAWSASWEATRVRFWELLIVHFLASFAAGIGAYVCYVGVIFTIPLYFTIVAAAYDDRLSIVSVAAAGNPFAPPR